MAKSYNKAACQERNREKRTNMQFNSIPFIFYFLPVFLLAYFSLRRELCAGCLILFSLVFYGLSSGGNLWWVAVLLLATVFSYGVNLLLDKHPRPVVLILGLGGLSALLVFFKLYQGGKYLPAGMSFYLFQAAAYMIDIFRGRLVFGRSYIGFCEQLLMFPKLLSGPLMNPQELQRQSGAAERRFDHVIQGLKTLILGLSLKVLLANRLGGAFGQATLVGYENISTPFAWMALISWTMQLYFDFYGYSLMAKGLGKMIGYDLPDNFLDPYASHSVSEFYRRWHASLGAWFREYLYFPLGGSRKGTLRTILNLGIVWLATGLWHGLGGNHLLWAGMIFFFIVNERLWLGKLLKRTRVLCHVYTVLAILLTWVPFAVGQWDAMVLFFGRLIGLFPGQFNPGDFGTWMVDYWYLLLAGCVLATPWPGKLWQRIRQSPLSDVICFVLFWVVVLYIATSAQDPFLYFAY